MKVCVCKSHGAPPTLSVPPTTCAGSSPASRPPMPTCVATFAGAISITTNGTPIPWPIPFQFRNILRTFTACASAAPEYRGLRHISLTTIRTILLRRFTATRVTSSGPQYQLEKQTAYARFSHIKNRQSKPGPAAGLARAWRHKRFALDWCISRTGKDMVDRAHNYVLRPPMIKNSGPASIIALAHELWRKRFPNHC